MNDTPRDWLHFVVGIVFCYLVLGGFGYLK
jgi:hypothetical protein